MNDYFELIQKAYINNEWVDASQKLTVVNPATKEIIGSVPNLGAQQTKAAIDAAQAALPAWLATAPTQRANLLMKWHDLILENKNALAQLISLEGGKPVDEANNEVIYGASFIRWFAEEGRRIYGDIIPADQATRRHVVTKRGIGVVAAITPWNFPVAMVTRKCAPALAAGCSVILKPSEFTPFSALALAKLAQQAGFPAGLFNVVTGDAAPIAQTFADDARVRKVSFTGSTRVGQILIEQSAKTVKKLSLELGGNAPLIIFSDANLDKALQGLLIAKFRNTGQMCICANRILIHEDIYDAFIAMLIPAVKALTIGRAFCDSSVKLGPLINEAAVQKVQRLVIDAKNKGANCLLGGNSLDHLGGYFFEPTILSNITSDMQIVHEEIFGPVIALQKFKEEDEAVRMANDTPAGLAAYVFTENASRLWRLMDVLEYGLVAANTGIFSDVLVPFGGIKYSGYGREGSKYGIEEYLEIRYMCWDIQQ